MIKKTMVNLLFPKYQSIINKLRKKSLSNKIKRFSFIFVGFLFCLMIYYACYAMLIKFLDIEIVGGILAKKFLEMITLTLLTILTFSNIIVAISNFYFSKDMYIILTAPIELWKIYGRGYIETLIQSSWMLVLFGIPFYIAYGVAHKAGGGFFIWAIFSLIPIILIASNIGIFIAQVLVAIFPARKTKDFLIILSIFSIIILYFLFRFLQPERLFNQGVFEDFVDYLNTLKVPTSIFLPSFWVTESITYYLNNDIKNATFFVILLILTAVVFIIFGNEIMKKIFLIGWNKSEDSKNFQIGKFGLDLFVKVVSFPFKGAVKAIIEKEIKTFFRDISQWSQIFLIIAIVVVYLFNIEVLPLDDITFPLNEVITFFPASFGWKEFIAFLNILFAGYVMTAISGRFLFTSISLEGEGYWIIATSPLPIKKFLWIKFLIYFLPIILLGEILVIIPNILLKVNEFLMIISIIDIFLMGIGISSLAIGMGAIYPNFKGEIAKISTSIEGLLFMIIGFILVTTNMILQAFPIYKILFFIYHKEIIETSNWIAIGILFFLSSLVLVTSFFLPIKLGEKSLQNEYNTY